ncbi:TRAP transporter substrate-binding protein [Vogesella oryzae]|uniref:TRAP transporter substrate-binding protein n=1 Tax=Vogesella oryzae TaxID=1735285 RepID=UPI0015843258|nr:TRAP transporter substrate-binding protein [Vogesella oryzae]
MQKFSKIAVLTGVALLGLAVSGQILAADIKERTLRFSFLNAKDHPQGLGAAKFAELVAKASGGKIQVKLFPSGMLGGDMQTVSALQGGTIDFTVLNAGLLSSQAKEFVMFDLPFLFNSGKEADAIVDGPVGSKLLAKLNGKGLVGLGYWELGFRHVTNNVRPVAKMEDIAGLKLRVVQSPLYIEMFSALGANPVPMPFTELYTALETKAVDGQENPEATILGTKLNEVQKYLSLTGHTYNPQVLLVSQKSWDKLSADEKALIQKAAREATLYQRKVNREATGQALAKLKTTMVVNELSAAEKTRIRIKLQGVTKKFSADVGEPLMSELNSELAKLR